MNGLRISFLLLTSHFMLVMASSDMKFESEGYFRGLMSKDEFLLEFLDLIIEKEERKVQDLKNILSALEEDIEHTTDLNSYTEDINKSLKLMKRMAYDWRVITNYVAENVTEDVMRSMSNRLASEYGHLPDPDIRLAIENLNRLRSFSDVTHSEFVNGNLGRVKLNSTLDANDCYLIGKHTLDYGDIVEATKWLAEAYRLVGNTEDIFKTNEKTLKLLAKIYFKTGRFEELKKEINSVIGYGKMRDDKPMKFLFEMEDLKTAAEAAAKNQTKSESTPKEKAEDLRPYADAYPKLPPILKVLSPSVKTEEEMKAQPTEADQVPPEIMEQLLGKSEEELMEMANKPMTFDELLGSVKGTA
nr:PREDICTED: prolyl 4-hydroxylase subunit alpha-2-like [Bemisia tabaci]